MQTDIKLEEDHVTVEGRLVADKIDCRSIQCPSINCMSLSINGYANIAHTLGDLRYDVEDLKVGYKKIYGVFTRQNNIVHAQFSGDVQCKHLRSTSINLHGQDLDERLRMLESKIDDIARKLSIPQP